MPKRKNRDAEYFNKKIKKLQKRLKRAQNLNVSVEQQSDVSDADSQKENVSMVPECDLMNLETDENINNDCEVIELENNEQENVNECEVAPLDKDILELLGDDPSNTIQYGKEIHKELATRLQHISIHGLTKEVKKDLQQKYLLPSNAILIGAPALNPEVKAALPENLLNRDKAIEAKQKLLAAAISGIASVITKLLEPKNTNKEMLKELMDANKILCDIQHSDSMTRRSFSSSILKKDIKPQMLNSKIDKLLFGENLAETLKTAKAVSKSSAEIKSAPPRRDRRPQPSTSKPGNLNFKGQVGPHRRPPLAAKRTQYPTSHQTRPGGPSKMLLQQQKTTNQRR